MGIALVVAAIVAAIALSQKHAGGTTAVVRAVNAPGLTVQDVVAGFVAAQNTSSDTLDKVAASVPGTNYAGALISVSSLIKAKNIPKGTATMSGALVTLVTMLYSFETEPATLSLYASALDQINQPTLAASFRAKASSTTRSMVLVNPVTGDQSPLLPPALKTQVDQALASGNASLIRAAATALQQAGFPSSAQALLAKIPS